MLSLSVPLHRDPACPFVGLGQEWTFACMTLKVCDALVDMTAYMTEVPS